MSSSDDFGDLVHHAARRIRGFLHQSPEAQGRKIIGVARDAELWGPEVRMVVVYAEMMKAPDNLRLILDEALDRREFECMWRSKGMVYEERLPLVSGEVG